MNKKKYIIIGLCIAAAFIAVYGIAKMREHSAAKLYCSCLDKKDQEQIDCYKQAAEQGNVMAQRKLGDIYAYEDALKWYRKAAKQGDSKAQYKLAEMYYHGHGIEEDCSEAAKWYRKVAKKGNVKAQIELGDIYYYHGGSEGAVLYKKMQKADDNYSKYKKLSEKWDQKLKEGEVCAVKWYRKAAEQGNAEGQYKLGEMYEKGEGVSQSKSEAIKWYQKAAENDDSYYSKYAERKLRLLNSEYCQEKENNEEKLNCYKEEAQKGNAYVQLLMGDIYYLGNVVKEDKAEAVKWYRKAAEQGNAKAQYELWEKYYFGWGVKEDKTEAAKWYRKAAEQGNAKTQTSNISYCYAKKNNKEKINCYKEEAEKGNVEAQINLCDNVFDDESDELSEKLIKVLDEMENADDNVKVRLYEELVKIVIFNEKKDKEFKAERVKWCRKAAEQGDSRSQYYLGEMYEKGWGVEPNQSEAIKWYEKAAENGSDSYYAEKAEEELYCIKCR